MSDDLTNGFLAQRTQAQAGPSPEEMAAANRGADAPAAPGPAPVTAPTEVVKPKSTGDRIVDTLHSIGSDLWNFGMHPSDIPKQAIGGIADAANNLVKFADKVTRHIESAGLPNVYFQAFDKDGKFSPAIMSPEEFHAAEAAGKTGLFQVPTTGDAKTGTGSVLRAITQFVIGRGAVAKGLGEGFAAQRAADFTSAAVFMDPNERRASNAVNDLAPNFLTDWLSAKPADEGSLLANVKNGLEMSGLGMLVEGTVAALKAAKTKFLSGKPSEDILAAPEGAQPPAAATGEAAGEGAEAAGGAGASAPFAEAPAVKPAKPAGAVADMENDLPWEQKTTEQQARVAAKAMGGTLEAPDSQAKEFLALGDRNAPAFEIGGPAPKASLVNEGEHAAAGEEFLAGERGVAHPPIDLADYLSTGRNPVKVNLAYIGSGDDIKDLLARVSASIPKGGVVGHDATIAAADALHMMPEEFLASNIGQSMAANREQMTALRFTLDSVSSQVKDLAVVAATPGAAAEDVGKFMKAYALHRSLLQELEGATAESGRTLNALQIMSRQSNISHDRMLSDLMNQTGPLNATELAARVAALPDPLAVGRFVKDSIGQTGRDTTLKVWFNDLLGPATVVKKLTSDGIMAMWNVATHYTAQNFGDNVASGRAMQLIYGYTKAFPDAIRAAGLAMRSGGSQFYSQFQSMEAIARGGIGNIAGEYGTTQPTMAAMDYLRMALPTTWVGAADDFAKVMNYRAELNSGAFQRATEKGLAGEEAQQYMDRLMGDVPADLHQEALSNTLRNTFQEPLQGVAESLQNLVDKINLPVSAPGFGGFEIPLGRMIVPFVKVPANIVRFSYYNSPLALMFKNDAMIQTLSKPGAARDLAMARIGLGTGLSMTAFGLALNGTISGGGPTDPQLRQAWMANNEPYSLKIGDKRYGYNQLEPVGLLMGAVADTLDVMKFAKDDDRDNLAASLAFGFSKAVLSKTYLSGLSDFMDAIQNGDKKGTQFLEHWAATAAVPNAVAGTTKALDDWRRAHYDFLHTIESRLPFVSEGLPPARTLWGDPIPLKDGYVPFAQGDGVGRMLSPIGVRDLSKVAPIDKWIYDNRYAFPQAVDNKLGISKPSQVQAFTNGGVTAQVQLTPWQFNHFQKQAGNDLKDPITGLGAKDTLNALVTGKLDGPTQSEWDKGSPEMRALVVQKVVNQFRAAAKQNLLDEFPSVKMVAETGWRQRAQALNAGQPGAQQ